MTKYEIKRRNLVKLRNAKFEDKKQKETFSYKAPKKTKK